MSNHLLNFGKQQADMIMAKNPSIVFKLMDGKNKYMLYDIHVFINNKYFVKLSDAFSISNLTKSDIDSFMAEIKAYKVPKKASFASAKVAVSYNGKNRDKQSMTYCKSSGEKTKDLLSQFIYDNLTLILECQIKNKHELKLLLTKLCLVYNKKYNSMHESCLYMSKNMINECISSFINYDDNKINGYLKKFNLKTNNQNDYALAIYDAISNQRITELV